MKYIIEATNTFSKWQSNLKDRQAARLIALRLIRVSCGNMGDVRGVGNGISEIRIFTGKGYRVYFVIRNNRLIVLLNGGDKSTQKRDIARAKQIMDKLED